MRKEFKGIAVDYQDHYMRGYNIMVKRIENVGWIDARDFYNNKYSNSMGKFLGLEMYFFSEGELDALVDKQERI